MPVGALGNAAPTLAAREPGRLDEPTCGPVGAVCKIPNSVLRGLSGLPKGTTSLGTKNNHAYYSHWRQSIIDYALWQAYVMNVDNMSDEDSWIDYINRSYSEIPGEYKRRLLAIKTNIENNKL